MIEEYSVYKNLVEKHLADFLFEGENTSLSLMEGKTCRYCGRNLDLKQFDWVIEKYDIT